MTFREINIQEIQVEDRDRQDYGDLESLAESIKRYGLLQPPTVTQDFRLIAGGRRLKACQDLLQWTTILVGIRDTASEAELKALELEENVRRKELSWQETVVAVCKIHKAHKQEAAKAGKEWTDEMTGELLGGYSKTYVWCCRDILPFLNLPEFAKLDSLTDAVRLRTRMREDGVLKMLATKSALPAPPSVPTSIPSLPSTLPSALTEALGSTDSKPAPVEIDTTIYDIPLSSTLLFGNCLKLMATLPDGFVDHIVCDPPYAIEMSNLDQSSTSCMDTTRVDDTHNVEDNLNLFSKMFPHFWRITKPESFVVLWCDITQWNFLTSCAEEVGFRVQRWPLVWCKTHQCKNQAAQFNFTKNTELAMVCRKPKATLPQPIQTSYILADNDEKLSNPFAKPFEVWRFIIESISIKGQTILDPFAGEGSSTLATVKCLRRYLAMEVDEKHYNQLLESMKQYWLGVLKNCRWV